MSRVGRVGRAAPLMSLRGRAAPEAISSGAHGGGLLRSLRSLAMTRGARPSPRRGSIAGFTLLELLVALVVAGFVVLLVHQTFGAVSDGVERVTAATAAQDRRENARRWLAETMLALEVGGEAGGFEGRPDAMRFTSWVRVPGGWAERRHVALGLVRGHLEARTDERRWILSDSATGLAFDYLLEPGAESHWVQTWLSPVSAPLAVRLRLARTPGVDTLLFLIKGRG